MLLRYEKRPQHRSLEAGLCSFGGGLQLMDRRSLIVDQGWSEKQERKVEPHKFEALSTLMVIRRSACKHLRLLPFSRFN